MSSGRRNTIEGRLPHGSHVVLSCSFAAGLEQQPSVATSPSADVPATPPSVLLPFVRPGLSVLIGDLSLPGLCLECNIKRAPPGYILATQSCRLSGRCQWLLMRDRWTLS